MAAGVNFVRTSANSNTSEGNFLVDGTPGDVVTYQVTLSTQPLSNVVLKFTSSDTTEGTVTPSLSFTGSNWNIPQIVTISGVDDMRGLDVPEGTVGGNIAEGAISYTITASVDQTLTTAFDYRYLFIPSLTLQNNDDFEDIPINQYGLDDVTFIMVDYMVGGNLNDHLHAGRGSDEVKGGFGDDMLYGDDGNDALYGQQGNDVAYGGYEYDTLNGDDGDDRLYGQEDNDVLNGGNGNDTLDGGLGADTIHGNSGNDIYFIDDKGDIVDEQDTTADSDSVYITILPITPFIYTLSANIENATLLNYGNMGLYGNPSNNILTGNPSDNTLNGGLGNDILNGGVGDDQILGEEGGDILNGQSNNDILYGGKQGDILNGDDGDDKLYGQEDNDILNGGNGNDLLSGGLGQDILTGGLDNDVFNLLDFSKDTIKDFSVVDDTIQLENAVFKKLTTNGVLNSAYFKTGAIATDSNDYLIYNKITGGLFYDADGNGANHAVQIALLANHPALTNADFFVI